MASIKKMLAKQTTTETYPQTPFLLFLIFPRHGGNTKHQFFSMSNPKLQLMFGPLRILEHSDF